MKLHRARNDGRNSFTGCGPGYVEINARRYDNPILVTPDAIEPWAVANFDALEAAHFESIARLHPEIVIFGSGATILFPPQSLLRSLIDGRIGFEAMDTRAACRTYNVLMSEGRNVAAALLPA